MERSAHGQLLVVDPVRVERHLALAGESAEEDGGAAGTDERDRVAPALRRAGRLDRDVDVPSVAGDGAELRCERAPLRAAADEHRLRARVRDARAEHQPDRAGAEHRDGLSLGDARALDAADAAGERLDERSDLRRQPGRHRHEIDARDSLRHDEQLRVGAVEERQQVVAQGLVAAEARSALAARPRVRRDHAPAGGDLDPAELVPEPRRHLGEQHGMSLPVRLQVGAVGERDLDLDENVARVPGTGSGTSSTRRSPMP